MSAVQASAIDLRDWLRDPEARDDLLELAQAGIELHRQHVGPLAPGEFARIEWPEIAPQELRVFERDGGLTVEDLAGCEVAVFP